MKIKRAATDFTADSLPASRPAVFFDCCKVRHRLLFALGGILLLFCLPLFVSHFTRDVMCAYAVADTPDDATRVSAVLTIRMWFRLIDIPCLLLLSVGLAGTLRVVRQLVFGEGVFLREDFTTGIRQNGGSIASLFFLGGLWLLLTEWLGTLRGSTGGLSYLPLFSGILLLLPIGFLLFFEAGVYQAKFSALLKNAVILYFRSVPTTLVAILPLLLPLAVSAMLDAFGALLLVKYAVLLLWALLLFPLTLLGESLYCNYLFDKHINGKYHPEAVDRGIHRKGTPE